MSTAFHRPRARDLGVDFVSITQPIDTTTPTGRRVYAVLAAVAETERDLIVDRVGEGMAVVTRAGWFATGPVDSDHGRTSVRRHDAEPVMPDETPGFIDRRTAVRDR